MVTWQVIRLWKQHRPAKLWQEHGRWLVTRKSLNSEITFDLVNQTVRKSSHRSLEPNFLRNELTAHRLLPKHTPEILDHGQTNGDDYVVTRYYPVVKKISWDEWPTWLVQYTSQLERMYLAHPVTKYTAADYLAGLMQQLQQPQGNPTYMLAELTDMIELFQQCIDTYVTSDMPLYTTFVHGDLVPNNVIPTDDSYYICDWSNGGEHTIVYDMMIQNFYSPDALVWQKFSEIDFINNSDLAIFQGWSKLYIQTIQHAYNISVTNQLVRAWLIACLLEASLKNFYRHQTKKEEEEGKNVLAMIKQILVNIVE